MWSAYGQDRAQPQLLKPPLCTLWHPVITSCVQTHWSQTAPVLSTSKGTEIQVHCGGNVTKCETLYTLYIFIPLLWYSSEHSIELLDYNIGRLRQCTNGCHKWIWATKGCMHIYIYMMKSLASVSLYASDCKNVFWTHEGAISMHMDVLSILWMLSQ